MSEIDYNTKDLQTSVMRLQEENLKLQEQALVWMKRCESYSIQCRKFEYELVYIKSRIWELKEAVTNKGKHPKVHDYIMKNQRRQWPRLWTTIDKLIAHYDRSI